MDLPASRVFKSKSFARFARKAKIDDASLCKAIANAEKGLIDADLGGGVIKQRVAREGGGKSPGFRTLVLFRLGDRAFFVHGFAKKDQANIAEGELIALRELASVLLSYDELTLSRAIENKTLIKVTCDG